MVLYSSFFGEMIHLRYFHRSLILLKTSFLFYFLPIFLSFLLPPLCSNFISKINDWRLKSYSCKKKKKRSSLVFLSSLRFFSSSFFSLFLVKICWGFLWTSIILKMMLNKKLLVVKSLYFSWYYYNYFEIY